MITGLVFILSYISGAPIPWFIYLLTSLVDGLLFIPVLSFTIVPFVRVAREKVGRLQYMQAVAPLKSVLLVLTPWGYEFAPARDVSDDPDDEQLVVQLANGTKFEPGDEQTWYRLGNRRFGVTFTPDARVMNDVLETDEDIETVGESKDGTYTILPQRGPFNMYTPYSEEPNEGFLVSIARAVNSLRGAGGVRLSEHTERKTRMEYGGGAQLSNTARAISYVGTIFIGALVGLTIFVFL